jgi:hypothetical protein
VHARALITQSIVGVPILAIAALGGALAARSPVIALALTVAASAACLLLLGPRLNKLFLGALLLLLIGYAFFDKAFAYIGLYPVYVSELVLVLALLNLISQHRHLRLTWLHWLLAAFMLMGAARTVPYLEQYGLDALRDGVIWGYGFFAIALSASLRTTHFTWIVRGYGWAIPIFLVWLLLASLVARFAPTELPTVFGTNVSILTLKTGDMGVQLAGIAAFTLLGLNREQLTHWATEAGLWLLWLLNVGIQGASGRASMLAAGMGFVAAIAVTPARRTLWRLSLAAILAGSVAAVAPTVDVGAGRSLSVEQISKNIASIVSDTGGDELEGTKIWRQIWWNEIIDYTFGGQYFWTGKGFGVNLATDDGIPAETEALRSPHNSHLTVLARMGVPGLGLWLLLQAAFGASLVGSYLRARRHRAMFWCQIDGWLFAYWLALIVNASFDVFFEGPQGGIWFWSIFGLGLAAMRIQRSLFDEADRAQETRLPTRAVLRPAYPASALDALPTRGTAD